VLNDHTITVVSW